MQPDSERPPGTPDSCGLLIQPGWLVFNNAHAVTHAEDCLPAQAIVIQVGFRGVSSVIPLDAVIDKTLSNKICIQASDLISAPWPLHELLVVTSIGFGLGQFQQQA